MTLNGVRQSPTIAADGSFSTTFARGRSTQARRPHRQLRLRVRRDFRRAAGSTDLTVEPAAVTFTIGNDHHVYGSTADLAADLRATFNTGVNGQDLAITYASTGNTTTSPMNRYAITGTVSDGTGLGVGLHGDPAPRHADGHRGVVDDHRQRREQDLRYHQDVRRDRIRRLRPCQRRHGHPRDADQYRLGGDGDGRRLSLCHRARPATGTGLANYTITHVPGNLVITKASSSFTLSGSIATAVVGQTATYTVKIGPVSPGAGSPTGIVSFMVDGTTIGTAAVDPASGLATLNTTSIARGTHSVMASYSGDSNFMASETAPVEIVVSPAGTQSVLTADAIRNQRGNSVSVNLVSQVLAASPGSGVPTGEVTFFRNGHRLQKGVLSNGTSTVNLRPNQFLKSSFTFEFGGDGNFDASASSPLVVNIKILICPINQLTGFDESFHIEGRAMPLGRSGTPPHHEPVGSTIPGRDRPWDRLDSSGQRDLADLSHHATSTVQRGRFKATATAHPQSARPDAGSSDPMIGWCAPRGTAPPDLILVVPARRLTLDDPPRPLYVLGVVDAVALWLTRNMVAPPGRFVWGSPTSRLHSLRLKARPVAVFRPADDVDVEIDLPHLEDANIGEIVAYDPQ